MTASAAVISTRGGMSDDHFCLRVGEYRAVGVGAISLPPRIAAWRGGRAVTSHACAMPSSVASSTCAPPPRRVPELQGRSAARPLAPGYRSRFEIYNLYHLLNHLNLFGSSYLGSVEQILAKYT